MSAAFTARSTTKAKSRVTGWNARQLQHGLGARRLGLAFRDAFEDHLEADQRALGVERLQRARMQFAEMAEHVLRADLDGAAAAGMEPGRPAGHHLHRLRRRAGGGQHRERVALGVEGVDRRRPCSTSAGRCRCAFASARRTPVAAVNWSSGLSPLKICPTSNSATSGKPRSAFFCAAAIRPGMRLGRMSESSAAIGLASASSALPPPNSSACGLEMNDQVTASTRPRAASARLALRVRTCSGGEHRLARRLAAVERRRGHAVDADDAHDLLDDVGLALDVGPPRRRGDLHAPVLAGDEEAELAQHAPHLGQRQVEAGEPLQFARSENR